MATELVEYHPVVACDPERMRGIARIRDGEARNPDPAPAAAPQAVSVDDSPGRIRGGCKSAMVDRDREGRSAEEARAGESHPVAEPEERITVDVRVDRGEVVRPRVEVEVRPVRLRRGGDHRALDVVDRHGVAGQVLDVVRVRCVDPEQLRRYAHRVELRARSGRTGAAVRRVGGDLEHQPTYVVHERAQVDDRERLYLDDRDPVQLAAEL